MLNKHKLFLLCAKWIPVVTAIGFNELSWSLKDFDGVKLQRIHKK